jgi:hypothetical protein
VSLGESIKSTFENAEASTGFPFADGLVCVVVGIWYWIVGIPDSRSTD